MERLFEGCGAAHKPQSDARDMRTIDFRCRPPVPAYKVLIDVLLSEEHRMRKFPEPFGADSEDRPSTSPGKTS